jgi:molecular chaperone GrpE
MSRKRHGQHEPPRGQDVPIADGDAREEAEPKAPTGEEQPVGIEAERDDLLGRLQRVSADFANYKKRIQREVEHGRRFANVELVRDLLSVLDDMERGIQAGRENHPPDDPLLVGMNMVHRKALDVLGRFGVERIEAVGKPFDPEEHSAMMQEPSEEYPPRTVVKELQTGYRMNGRTIRPAAVVVSTEGESGQHPAGDEESEEDA